MCIKEKQENTMQLSSCDEVRRWEHEEISEFISFEVGLVNEWMVNFLFQIYLRLNVKLLTYHIYVKVSPNCTIPFLLIICSYLKGVSCSSLLWNYSCCGFLRKHLKIMTLINIQSFEITFSIIHLSSI